MGKHAVLFFCLVFSGLAAVPVTAAPVQEQPVSAAPPAEETVERLYDVQAEDGETAERAGRALELAFGVFNGLFRFDPGLQDAPLRVRVFGDKEAYDGYVAGHLGETRPGAVYLHYGQAEKNELVILADPEAGPEAAHQAFIQFLRAFIPNPPSWIREGFAVFFSTLRFNPSTETLEYEENLLPLGAAKALGDKLPAPGDLLMADVSGTPAEFQVASWALVSFLFNGGRDYYRILTDSFMVLSPDAGAAENSLAVMRRVSLWNGTDAFGSSVKSYLESRKTFAELLEDGHRAYSLGDFTGAELSFLSALDQRPRDYAPYYYLGLLAYEGKNHAAAEAYYLSSLERGADAALLNYALGLNAAAEGRGGDARAFLQKAAAGDPAKYRARVDDLLKNIGTIE